MKTRNMKADLIAAIKRLETMDASELGYAISDLVDELSSRRVTVRCQVATAVNNSPVPEYVSSRDGDYSAWLASVNCD